MPVRNVPESQRREISRRSGALRPSARIGGSLPSDRIMVLSVIMPIRAESLVTRRFLLWSRYVVRRCASFMPPSQIRTAIALYGHP